MDNAIDLKTQAPGFLENLQTKFDLDDMFPKKIGRTIAGVQCYVDRELKIAELKYDPETTVISLLADGKYSTSDNSVINQAGLGISFPFQVDTKYNVSDDELTQLKVKFDLPKNWGKIDADLTIIKRVLEGDLSAALEVIPNFGLVKRETSSEYDEQKKWYQNKYGGPEYVYFASSDFVRWASPETAGRWILSLILSGGAAASAIAAEAKAQRKELAHVVKWLEGRAVASAPSVAEDFVTGKPLSLPQLKLFWQRVVYKSKTVIATRPLPAIVVPHGAFVLVWQDDPTAPADYNPLNTSVAEDNEPRPKWRIGAKYVIGPSGCRVIFTQPGGPASKANIEIDDLITQVAGIPVGDPDGRDRLLPEIKRAESQALYLEIVSGGVTKSVTVILDPIL